MKSTRLSLIVLITILVTACSNPQPQKHLAPSTKEELTETIAAFNKAFQDGDVDALETMITEDYIHTNGNAQAIRGNDWLSYLRKREEEILSGKLRVSRYEMKEVVVEYHGQVAIVTGKVTVTSEQAGEMLENEYRVTNIWVYEEGMWKRAGFHDGKIQ